ncbi:MAG: hypothetical protein ACI8Z5_001410, partial [Lentimonas sp.]
ASLTCTDEDSLGKLSFKNQREHHLSHVSCPFPQYWFQCCCN